MRAARALCCGDVRAERAPRVRGVHEAARTSLILGQCATCGSDCATLRALLCPARPHEVRRVVLARREAHVDPGGAPARTRPERRLLLGARGNGERYRDEFGNAVPVARRDGPQRKRRLTRTIWSVRWGIRPHQPVSQSESKLLYYTLLKTEHMVHTHTRWSSQACWWNLGFLFFWQASHFRIFFSSLRFRLSSCWRRSWTVRQPFIQRKLNSSLSCSLHRNSFHPMTKMSHHSLPYSHRHSCRRIA